MHDSLIGFLRCPFCGTGVSLEDNPALVRTGDRIDFGVLGCECCAFPIVGGIPVMIADDPTRDAMHAMEAGHHDDALLMLLGLDGTRASAFRALMDRPEPATYREAIEILSPDPEGTYFVYRFSDPTYVVAQALLQALGAQHWPIGGRVLDLCGGCGHLTRVLTGMRPAGGTTLADVYFWKLWLASRFVAPDAVPVCCDANLPLPFPREAFSLVFLLDAFPYIWQRRLLADEMMRVAGPEGAVVLPHLHSSLGENFAAGMALTPGAYLNLFAPQQAHLFSDTALLSQVLDERALDLARGRSAEEIGDEASLTIVASRRPGLFRRHDVVSDNGVTGELRINPLYQVEQRQDGTVLTLTFPTAEYEEEFGECRRYLPSNVTLPAGLTQPLQPSLFGADYAELRRRRILIDAPKDYF